MATYWIDPNGERVELPETVIAAGSQAIATYLAADPTDRPSILARCEAWIRADGSVRVVQGPHAWQPEEA
jgi:hypothetical protein